MDPTCSQDLRGRQRGGTLQWKALLAAAALAACHAHGGTDAYERAAAAPRGSDARAAQRLVREEGAVLIDVRSAVEYWLGHVEGAHHIPFWRIARRLDEVRALTGDDFSAPIVLYCLSGHRAAWAKRVLEAAGYMQVTNAGGILAWRRAEKERRPAP